MEKFKLDFGLALKDPSNLDGSELDQVMEAQLLVVRSLRNVLKVEVLPKIDLANKKTKSLSLGHSRRGLKNLSMRV
jgi:hypothetical protein